MTIAEALAEATRYKPNHKANEAELLKWLDEVETKIFTDVIIMCEDAPEFLGYDSTTPRTTTLLVNSPYTVLYRLWLCANIDMLQGNYDTYSEEMTLFNQMYEQYKAWYIRSHTPKETPPKYF